MANTLANLARMYTETTGTGTLTLTSAVPGFNSFQDAGVPNGATITYAIYCGPHREIGAGVWTQSTKTLTRGTVYSSTSAGAKINLTGRSEVFITPAKEDFDTLGGGSLADGDYGDIVVSGSGTVLSIDSAVATTFGRSLMDDADNTAARTTLGLGTMATETASNYLTTSAAASGYQPLDADLTAIAALTSAANKVPYSTGAGAWALADFSTAGRNLVDDATTADQRTTLGLGSMATETAANYLTTAAAASTYQPLDADLTSIAALTTAAYGRSLLTTTSEANFKATVNLEIGVDVQAYDAELAAIAGLTSAADRLPYFTGLGTAALATFTTAGRNLVDDADASAQRTTLGLGTGDSPQFTSVNIGNASDTTVARVSAGVISVEGNTVAMLNTLNTFTQNQLIQKASGNLNIIATSGDATNYVAAVSGNAATTRWVHWTGAAVSDRWLFGKDATAESGSDAGSNFACYNYTDAGAFKAIAFTMLRSDNSVNWRGGQYSNGVTGGSQGNGTLNFATLYENGTSLASKYAALASSNTFTQPQKMPSYTVAGLPAGSAGLIAFASNGRKNGEGAGLGTGVLVFHDGTAWRACDTGATVAA